MWVNWNTKTFRKPPCWSQSIAKLLKHHFFKKSSLRPTELISFYLRYHGRLISTCYCLCLSLRRCRGCFNILMIPWYFKSALCTFCIYTYISLMFWKVYSRVKLFLPSRCLFLFFLCLSLSVSGLNPGHLLGKCSIHEALSPAAFWWRFYPSLFVHILNSQSSPSVIDELPSRK